MELLRLKQITYRTIRPTVGDYKQKTCLSRHDTVLLNRLRIGHTRLTHSYSQVMTYLNVVLVSAH